MDLFGGDERCPDGYEDKRLFSKYKNQVYWILKKIKRNKEENEIDDNTLMSKGVRSS